MPAMFAIAADHAPAALTTVRVAIEPCVVSTDAIAFRIERKTRHQRIANQLCALIDRRAE